MWLRGLFAVGRGFGDEHPHGAPSLNSFRTLDVLLVKPTVVVASAPNGAPYEAAGY